MELLLLVSSVLTIVVGTYVAFRIVALARRTGGRPEWALGIGLVAFASVAYPLLLVVSFMRDLAPAVATGLFALCALAYVVTLAGLSDFTASVFTAGATWARLLSGAIVAVGAFGATAMVVQSGAAVATAGRPSLAGSLLTVAFTATFAWAGTMGIRHWLAMRRRARLGLADAVMTNRFFLWGFGMATLGVLDLILLSYSLRGVTMSEAPISGVIQAFTGLLGSVCWYLSFTPPSGYLRWVRSRAAEQPAA